MDKAAIVLTVGVSDAMAARMRRAADRDGFRLVDATGQAEAFAALRDLPVSAVIVNLGMVAGSPLAVSDYASYRRPDARIIYEMGAGGGFADGSIFAHSANAHGVLTPDMPPADVAAVVAHHARASR